MTSAPLSISVGYAAIGGASVLAGSALSLRVPLACRARSLAHHAAAGTVLAGLVVDVLAIGASVNIYLILEELLRDAHETDLGAWEVAVLFGAFMPFFLAGIALK